MALITLLVLAVGGKLWSMEPPPLVLQLGPSIAAGPGPSIAAGAGSSIAAGSGPSIAAEPGPPVAAEPGPPIATEPEPSSTAEPEPSIAAEPEPSIAAEPEWRRGATDAVIRIDIFVDWGCSSCIEQEFVASQVVRFRYPQCSEMVYHPYPNTEYFLADGKPIVSEALEAAGEQGKFWEFHDKIVLNTPQDVAGLKKVAREMFLDVQMFGEALDSGKYTEKVELAKQKAISQGVTHHAIFINGKEYCKYPTTVDGVCEAIAEELAKIGMEGS